MGWPSGRLRWPGDVEITRHGHDRRGERRRGRGLRHRASSPTRVEGMGGFASDRWRCACPHYRRPPLCGSGSSRDVRVGRDRVPQKGGELARGSVALRCCAERRLGCAQGGATAVVRASRRCRGFRRAPGVRSADDIAGNHRDAGPADCRHSRSASGGAPVVMAITRAPGTRAYEYRHVVGFEETNLLGSVYYVNLIRWQGRCRELFLREYAPDVLKDMVRGVALVTTHCSCDYLDEVRVFDEVIARLRRGGLAQNRITLLFEYVRHNMVVARGEQRLACVRRTDAGTEAEPLPGVLADAFERFHEDKWRINGR